MTTIGSEQGTARRPLRDQAGELLTALRGRVTRTAVAERLDLSRQALMKLERGGVSLDRLDQLAEVYGVRFALIAVTDDATWACTLPTPAPGLADLLPAPAASSS